METAPFSAVLEDYEKHGHKWNLLGLVRAIEQWHYDKNLVNGSTPSAQLIKLDEEFRELKASVANSADVRDDIGDMLVVMILIALQEGWSLEECVRKAWEDIKDRKGKMVDGIFVKNV